MAAAAETSTRADELLETAVKLAQKCVSSSPVIVLGTGASMPYGIPGMQGLKEYLVTALDGSKMSAGTRQSWEMLKGVLPDTDLESALQAVNAGTELTRLIVENTWSFLIGPDISLLNSVVLEPNSIALTRLFKHMFRSTQPRIAVVTTNYDRLAEYACDAGGWVHFTGFGPGYVRSARAGHPRLSFKNPDSTVRTVEIWKVHGSLDWFVDDAGRPVSLPCACHRPTHFSPAIVTPGFDKYRMTHMEPFRSIITRADEAIMSGKAFLAVGYGFNDAHIEPKLVERCQRDGALIVVLTKALTRAARGFLAKCPEYLAFEEFEGRTRLFSSLVPGGFEVDRPGLWEMRTFLNYVT